MKVVSVRRVSINDVNAPKNIDTKCPTSGLNVEETKTIHDESKKFYMNKTCADIISIAKPNHHITVERKTMRAPNGFTFDIDVISISVERPYKPDYICEKLRDFGYCFPILDYAIMRIVSEANKELPEIKCTFSVISAPIQFCKHIRFGYYNRAHDNALRGYMQSIAEREYGPILCPVFAEADKVNLVHKVYKDKTEYDIAWDFIYHDMHRLESIGFIDMYDSFMGKLETYTIAMIGDYDSIAEAKNY